MFSVFFDFFFSTCISSISFLSEFCKLVLSMEKESYILLCSPQQSDMYLNVTYLTFRRVNTTISPLSHAQILKDKKCIFSSQLQENTSVGRSFSAGCLAFRISNRADKVKTEAMRCVYAQRSQFVTSHALILVHIYQVINELRSSVTSPCEATTADSMDFYRGCLTMRAKKVNLYVTTRAVP